MEIVTQCQGTATAAVGETEAWLFRHLQAPDFVVHSGATQHPCPAQQGLSQLTVPKNHPGILLLKCRFLGPASRDFNSMVWTGLKK